MLVKQTIKKVFEDEFNIETMRNQILLRENRKELRKMSKFLKYVLPVCFLTIFCSVLMLHNTMSSFKEENKNTIHINKIDILGSTKIDARMDARIEKSLLDCQDITFISILKDGIRVPDDLNQFQEYEIYTKKAKTSEYTILNCYVYNYSNSDSKRDIRIAFSNTNHPVRDYRFSEESRERSIINNYELFIYQYEDIYFAEFTYKDYYFDIETQGITIQELTALLESVIL